MAYLIMHEIAQTGPILCVETIEIRLICRERFLHSPRVVQNQYFAPLSHPAIATASMVNNSGAIQNHDENASGVMCGYSAAYWKKTIRIPLPFRRAQDTGLHVR